MTNGSDQSTVQSRCLVFRAETKNGSAFEASLSFSHFHSAVSSVRSVIMQIVSRPLKVAEYAYMSSQ